MGGSDPAGPAVTDPWALHVPSRPRPPAGWPAAGSAPGSLRPVPGEGVPAARLPQPHSWGRSWDTARPASCPSLLPGCAAQRNFCEGTWCQNGGTCVSRWDTHLCRCPLRFGGKNCEHGEPGAGPLPGARGSSECRCPGWQALGACGSRARGLGGSGSKPSPGRGERLRGSWGRLSR